MRRRYIWLSLLIVFSIFVVSLWLVHRYGVQNNPVIIAKTPKKQSIKTITINEEQTLEEDISVPKFALKAVVKDTKNTQALMSINKEESKWFQRGDNIIDNYILHDIKHSFVTLFDCKGAYYEIYLSDNPAEDDFPIENNDNNTVETDIEHMIPLGDGQYISYGDKDVSDDIGKIEEMAYGVEEVDTSGQTIVYGDEDVSNQVGIEDKIQDGQVDIYNSGQTIIYGAEDVSQDIQRRDQELFN